MRCSLSEIEILERDGDVFCPCRIRTGDPKEDLKIVCPCIPFFRDQFAALGKCWCGLFIRTDVEDGAELIGVIEEPEPGTSVEVPVCRLEDLAENTARHVKIGKNDIAVVRVGDEVFALSNVCQPRVRPAFGGLRRRAHDSCARGMAGDTTFATVPPTTPTPTYEHTRRPFATAKCS